MKSFIIFIILLTSQIACASEWVRVDTSTTEENHVYIDVESIDKVNPLTSFWIKRQEPSGKYLLGKVIINCDAKEIAVTDSYTCDKNGEAIHDEPNRPWKAIIPNSHADSLYKLSCASQGYDDTIEFVKYRVINFRQAFFEYLKTRNKHL